MNFLSVILVIVCLCETVFCIGLSCMNEKDAPVDWFFNYKLPKLEDRSSGSLLGQGLAYAYLLSNSKKWTLSENSISSATSMLGNTLRDFYNNKEDLTYLLYNDEPADEISGSSVGHTKGILVFDENSGFWIIHSIPKFPSVDSYGYPSNGIENGQSILCITFEVQTLNEIGKQLLHNSPMIYEKRLNSAVKNMIDEDVQSLFSDSPNFIRKPPFERVVKIKSQGRMRITSFAKDNQYEEDLYSALIAPELKTSLFVETWRRGSGTKLDPACQLQYQVLDVQSINMIASQKRKSVKIGFSSMEDHSKWAISQNSKTKWVCVGDINRMESQKKRGGGAACFTSTNAWNAFNSSIGSLDNCNVKK